MKDKHKRNIGFSIIALIVLSMAVYASTTITDNYLTTGTLSGTNATINNLTQTGRTTITNPGANNALVIDQNGNAGSSTSTGGALLIESTGQTGAGLVSYSARGSDAAGHLIVGRVNNQLFPQSAIYATSNGASHTAVLLYTGNDTGSSALNLVSSNTNYTALSVSGNETGHGTIKVSHTYPGRADSNAAAISVNIDGVGTSAQGLYIYSDGNTTGNLISLNNPTSKRRLFVDSNGTFVLGSNDTIKACNSVTAGGIYYDGTTRKHYGCNSTTWNALY